MSRLTNKKIVDLKDGEFLSISKEEYRKQVHEAPTYKEVYTKLGKLEDLEDELGCPIEVVFKALKEGLIIEAYDDELDISSIETFEPNELVLDFVAKSIITGEEYIDYVFPLENYKKTWWLNGDRSE